MLYEETKSRAWYSTRNRIGELGNMTAEDVFETYVLDDGNPVGVGDFIRQFPEPLRRLPASVLAYEFVYKPFIYELSSPELRRMRMECAFSPEARQRQTFICIGIALHIDAELRRNGRN